MKDLLFECSQERGARWGQSVNLSRNLGPSLPVGTAVFGEDFGVSGGVVEVESRN